MADSGLETKYPQSITRNTTSDTLNAEIYKEIEGKDNGQITEFNYDNKMSTNKTMISDPNIENEVAPKDQEFSGETNSFEPITTLNGSENHKDGSISNKEKSEGTTLQEIKGEQQKLIKELSIPIELAQNFAPEPFKFDPDDLNIPIKYDHTEGVPPKDLPSLVKKLDMPYEPEVLISTTFGNDQFNPAPDKAASEMAECDDTEPFYIYPKTKGQTASQSMGFNNMGAAIKHQYNSLDYSNSLGFRELSNKLGFREPPNSQGFKDLSNNQLGDLSNRRDFTDLNKFDSHNDRVPMGLINYDAYVNKLLEANRNDFYKKHPDGDFYGFEDSRYKRRRGSAQFNQSKIFFNSEDNLQHHNLKLSQTKMGEPSLVGKEIPGVQNGREYYDPELYNRDLSFRQDYGRITFSDMVNGFQSANTHTYSDTAASHSFEDTLDNSQPPDEAPDLAAPPVTVENWAQCENCKKWRRLPLTVDTDQLPDTWVCSLNVWDPAYNSCNVPEEIYPEHNSKNVIHPSNKISDNENFEFNQIPINSVGLPYHETKHHKRSTSRSKPVSKGYNLMANDMSDISLEEKRYSRDFTDRDGMRTPTINSRYYEDNTGRDSSRRMSMTRSHLSPIVSNVSSYDEECEVVKFNLPSPNTHINAAYFNHSENTTVGEFNDDDGPNPFEGAYTTNLKMRRAHNQEKFGDSPQSHPLRDRITLYSDNLTSLLATELPHSALFLDNSKRHTVKEDEFAHDETKPKDSVTKDVYIKEEGNINLNYAYKTRWNHRTDECDMDPSSYSYNEPVYPDRERFNALLQNRSDFLRIYNRLSTQIPTLSEISANEDSQFSNSPEPETSDGTEDYDSTDDQNDNPEMDNYNNGNTHRNSISKIIDKNDLLQLLYNFAQKQVKGDEALSDQDASHCNNYKYVNNNLNNIIKYKDQLDVDQQCDSMDNPELVNYEPVDHKIEIDNEDQESNHYEVSCDSSLKLDKETNEELSRDDQSDDDSEMSDDQMSEDNYHDDNLLTKDKKNHLDYPLPNIKQLSKRYRNLDTADQQNLNLDDPELNSNYSMLMQPIPQNFTPSENLKDYNNNIIKMLSIPITYKSNEQELKIQPDSINLLSLPIPDLSLPDLSMSDLNNSTTQYVA
uniref:CW-type Zinc Finger, putative n=1 Tax=Theileria annulata TaxID=5874 RepID=A0A3B0NA46_THEAN